MAQYNRYLLVIIAHQFIKKEIHFKYITSCITITYTKHGRPVVDIICPKRRRAKQGGLHLMCNLCQRASKYIESNQSSIDVYWVYS